MRVPLYTDRLGWIHKLDHRKLILIAFLVRFIFASFYDCLVSVKGDDIIVPDSRQYSARGRFVELLFRGYGKDYLAKDAILGEAKNRNILGEIFKTDRGMLPRYRTEGNLFVYIIGVIYFIFGYFPLGVRVFNIALSLASAYFIFRIAKRHFSELTANLFLLAALFLPTQTLYSLTLSRDFLRVFVVSLILWVIYG